jgi:predicted amino acid racemase
VNLPRLEIRLDQIRHNAELLVERLGRQGIAVCGVTKATLGSPEIANELLLAGVSSLGESRIENIERLRRGGITAEIILIRSPMLSQVDRVVAGADLSLNSEHQVIARLSEVARRQERRHGVILMVELGDLREGLMPSDLSSFVEQVLSLDHLDLRGIGTNLACQSGVIPDASNMAELSALAESIESEFAIAVEIVSGGNSANLNWALDGSLDCGRINHLRLGESILLGCEPTNRIPLEGLHGDAISLMGEVIESKIKPSEPWGMRGQTAFGPSEDDMTRPESGARIIVALGRQDVDPDGLVPPPPLSILGTSSDHLVLASSGEPPQVGSAIRFELGYSALLRSMTSPFVTQCFL